MENETHWKRYKKSYYFVSKDYEIWSKLSNKILKQYKNNRGYWYVDLYVNKKKERWLVSRLGALLWKGKSSLQAAHIDHNKDNNSDLNIKYKTQSENIKDDFECGRRSHKGERHPQAKLKDIQVKILREKHDNHVALIMDKYIDKDKKKFENYMIYNFTIEELCEFIGIHKRTYQAAIEKRETFKHLLAGGTE